MGTDSSTDLAVIKVNQQNLPAIKFGNSDDVNVGEWVLAVGNPFNLTSTVTAGIVSAKGRNINILRDKFPIESFIQTDAAINPGNSGGALVNTQGTSLGSIPLFYHGQVLIRAMDLRFLPILSRRYLKTLRIMVRYKRHLLEPNSLTSTVSLPLK